MTAPTTGRVLIGTHSKESNHKAQIHYKTQASLDHCRWSCMSLQEPPFICGNFIRLFMFHFIWANLSPSQLACWALRNRCMWSLTAAWQTWLVPLQCWVILPHLLLFWSLSTLSYHRAAVHQWRFDRESLYLQGEKKVCNSIICLLFPKRSPPISQCFVIETESWFWSICISSLN